MTAGPIMRVPYRYLSSDRDRHGNVRVYYRRSGRKIRIAETLGSDAFRARYDDIHAAFESGAPPPAPDAQRLRGPRSGTIGWLFESYHRSAEFGGLDPSTQATRRRLAAHMTAEPVFPGSAETYDGFPLDRLSTQALEVLRDRARATPGTANDRVKTLRAAMKWARTQRLVRANPAIDLRKLRVVTRGHHTWSPDEVDQFEAAHPVGTRACLAMRLMLYTGARRSDAVRLGRQHVRGGVITWTAWKNRNRHPTEIVVPLLAPLAEAIAAAPGGGMVWLLTDSGRPFSIAGFGNWFRARCREAGLSHCSAHGLRKAGSTRAAEAGATAHQLMSIYGWRSLAEAETYTRAAERKRLAAAGSVHLLAGLTARHSATNVPPQKKGETK
jgi:integrase